MRFRIGLVIILIACFLMAGIGLLFASDLFVLVGAASKPAMEELIEAFMKKTGLKIEVSYGGSGVLLAQLQMSGRGDLYFPGSIDFIEHARRLKLIDPASVKKVVYLVPAICVQKGNPKNIKSLKDLCKKNVRIIIGNPECVCLGVFAAEMADKLLTSSERKQFRKNIVNFVDSCSKVANSIALKTADAVIGWRVLEYWNKERIQTVKLPADEIIRISYLSIAITKNCKNRKLAEKFIEFMLNDGMKYFKKFHYFTKPEDAIKYVGAKKPIGGKNYKVPPFWIE